MEFKIYLTLNNTIMKRILGLLVVVISLSACQEKLDNNYITITGKIINPTTDSLIVQFVDRKDPKFKFSRDKIIIVDKNGNFKDTLSEGKKLRVISYDKKGMIIRGEKGEIKFNFDASDLRKTINFEGNSADYNNYVAKRTIFFMNEIHQKELYKLPRQAYEVEMNKYSDQLETLMVAFDNLDSFERKSLIDFNRKYLNRIEKGYDNGHELALKLAPGKISPSFKNYINFDGGVTSLIDFKGSYVYIDLWATWCAPCKVQIPFLIEAQETYKDNNIKFVSISIDAKTDFEKWKNFVKTEGLKGIQLYAENKEFTMEYGVSGIPRFIFIGTNGEIINFDAPRPSQKEELKALFEIVKS